MPLTSQKDYAKQACLDHIVKLWNMLPEEAQVEWRIKWLNQPMDKPETSVVQFFAKSTYKLIYPEYDPAAQRRANVSGR